MDLFLQQLRDLPLEEGKTYIFEHIEELADHEVVGNLMADEALRVLYTPFLSLKLAELLIFYGEYVDHLSSHALGLKAKGDALEQIGHHQVAMECLDTAGEEFLSVGDEGNWARSRISWMLATAWLGRVEEALQGASYAREAFVRLDEYFWACAIDHNMAMIYDHMGRYQEAIELYKNMLVIYPTLTDQSEVFIKQRIALAEMNQAVHLAWLGNFEQAYRLQEQARASFTSLGEIDLVIASEVNLADFDYIQCYYGSALRHYYRARDSLLQNNIDNPILLAELKLCMANCLVKLNRPQEATVLAAEVVEIERRLGVSLNSVYALGEYATTLLASGRPKESLTVLDEVLAICNQKGFEHRATVTKLQQAEILLKMGDFAAAYDYASTVKEYFEVQGLLSYAVRASLVIVDALVENARQAGVRQDKVRKAIVLQEAVSLCKEIIGQAHQHNLQEAIYKSHYLLGRLSIFQENPTKATRHYMAAIAQIERILDDLVYDFSPSFLHTTWTVYEDMIALCLQQGQVERAFNYLEQARSMALRQYLSRSTTIQREETDQQDSASRSVMQENRASVLRIQQELKYWQEQYRDYSVLLGDIDTSVSPAVDQEVIQNELKQCEAKISELFERLHLYQAAAPTLGTTKRKGSRAKQIDIMQLRQRLSHDQLLLAYFMYKGRLVIFAATREQLITHENPEGAAQLELLLPLLHAHLQPAGWPNQQQPPQQVIRRLLNRLYQLLIAPIESLLPSPEGSLTIVPYGPLHNLPFHALHNGSHFLIEDFQIRYLPASNLLMHLGTYESEQEICSIDTRVSSKSPLVFGYSENGHLHRVLDEANTVASLLNARCYLERDATIHRLIEQASGSPIIHLATHGRSRLDAPNFSYIRLADGQLNAIDAFSLNLKGCELVTLSGCETGLALSGGGDEQLGLGRAFLAAGAESLVMSLWQVEDNATKELMQVFYKYLLQGESKMQALRAAQCQLLQSISSSYTHPYFWAAFRLVGGVGPLKYQSAKERSLVLGTEALKK